MRKSKAKGSSLAPTPHPMASTPVYASTPTPSVPRVETPVAQAMPSAMHDSRAYPPRHPLPTVPQAFRTTYPSRLRTGATLLMQPILSSTSVAAAVATRSSRRGGVINYADPGSGDEFPDAGALDSDDSDFIASGGTRTALRATTGRLSSRAPVGAGVFSAGGVTHIVQAQRPATPQPLRNELDQSYLGLIPPDRFIVSQPAHPMKHEYL